MTILFFKRSTSIINIVFRLERNFTIKESFGRVCLNGGVEYRGGEGRRGEGGLNVIAYRYP